MKTAKIAKILDITNRITTLKNDKSLALYTYFENSVLWKDIDIWNDLFVKLVNGQLKNTRKPKRPKNFRGLMNSFQSLLKKDSRKEKTELVV